jgi:hypothetical protein
MSWGDDDIHLGNFSEIGESLRGMQDTSSQFVGAAKALSQLRGALGNLAQQRFGHHAPTSKQMRSPYKDSTQIGISSVGTFTSGSWVAGAALPTMSGLTRVYKSFKPTKAILTELVTTTFSTSALGASTVATNVPDASDLVLILAFSGADNCFPNAPTEASGIGGATFAYASLGNGISWPTINGGIDMTVSFSVEQSALYRVTPPAGYTTASITSVSVKLRFNLLGPSLR